jgi:hypothetical protein
MLHVRHLISEWESMDLQPRAGDTSIWNHLVAIASFFEIEEKQPSKYCCMMAQDFGFVTRGCQKASLKNGQKQLTAWFQLTRVN